VHIYEQLWQEAQQAFQRGEPRLDPYLLNKANDQRRGLSLAFKLPPAVRANIVEFLGPFAAAFPGQYFYQAEELHVTVLTFMSATENWRREIRELPAYRDILDQILAKQPAFTVSFNGVTAAPNAMMVQGLPADNGLNLIRAEIRRAFGQRGLGDHLDRRYSNQAAHVTAMRFRSPDTDWNRFAAMVAQNRQIPFGEARVQTLQLVLCDWYASVSKTKVIAEYNLVD